MLETVEGQIVVLEPRRLAARWAARRVAEERGERVGETVGYQVRFEDFSGPRTRLRYVTEGVLNRRLASDRMLRGVSAVVLDEFHERHLEGDLALALLLALQRSQRPDLRLIVMSATLDAGPIATHLDDCPILTSEGRLFPLEIRYTPESNATLEERVAGALDTACRQKQEGDVLIFLPGAAEIRRAIEASAGVARRHDLASFALSGDLSVEEQDRALAPHAQRKAIFSTNVAESSVTIPGVAVVIDAGLARMASDSRSTGVAQLILGKISQASATQRAGRAARTQAGLCIRLYTEQDFLSRPKSGAPEVLQRELSGLLLQLRAMGIEDPAGLPWLTKPRDEDLGQAARLLDEIGARGAAAARMAAMPLHPRLARVLMEGERRGVGGAATRICALLSAGQKSRSTDLIHAADLRLDGQAERVARQLEKQIERRRDAADWERPLAECLLAGYPDRVAKRRRGDEYEIAGGISAKLAAPLPKEAEWIVAVDVEERSDKGMATIRAAAPIEANWLLEVFPDSVESVERYTWNRQSERVEEESALVFHGLTLEANVDPRPKSRGAAAFLAQRVREAGWRRFLDVEAVEALLARADFARQHGWNGQFDENDIFEILETMCEGRSGFDQLREGVANGEWAYQLWLRIDPGTMESIAPERIQLPGGRGVPVHYVKGQAPWIESRLQDFWGMTETPRVARGQVPVLVHLLAPNKRPVQMTQDLGSFWARLYPEIRTQLSRRYPKHQWP